MTKNVFLKKASILVFTAILTGCSHNSNDIKLNDLKTPCDYIDAMIIVTEDMLLLKGEKSDDQFSSEEKTKMKELESKFKEINMAAYKKYTAAEAKECENFDLLKEKLNKVTGRKERSDEDRASIAKQAQHTADSINNAMHQ